MTSSISMSQSLRRSEGLLKSLPWEIVQEANPLTQATKQASAREIRRDTENLIMRIEINNPAT